MRAVRLGAVGYLNARPLVYGLADSSRFDLRFDVPARCAELLHGGAIDLGLIPTIEYLNHPSGPGAYAIVPGVAIASRGPVASVAIFTTRPLADVRSLALDTSSRTSVALVRVLCARVFGIRPALESRGPDLKAMLADCDAALLIGDNALVQDGDPQIEKIDLGDVWAKATGLPFVYAFWAGRPGSLQDADVKALQSARDLGIDRAGEIAAEYFRDAPGHRGMGERYLRDNIKYSLGDEEIAGLELFYRYAVETGAADRGDELRFF